MPELAYIGFYLLGIFIAWIIVRVLSNLNKLDLRDGDTVMVSSIGVILWPAALIVLTGITIWLGLNKTIYWLSKQISLFIQKF